MSIIINTIRQKTKFYFEKAWNHPKARPIVLLVNKLWRICRATPGALKNLFFLLYPRPIVTGAISAIWLNWAFKDTFDQYNENLVAAAYFTFGLLLYSLAKPVFWKKVAWEAGDTWKSFKEGAQRNPSHIEKIQSEGLIALNLTINPRNFQERELLCKRVLYNYKKKLWLGVSVEVVRGFLLDLNKHGFVFFENAEPHLNIFFGEATLPEEILIGQRLLWKSGINDLVYLQHRLLGTLWNPSFVNAQIQENFLIEVKGEIQVIKDFDKLKSKESGGKKPGDLPPSPMLKQLVESHFRHLLQ